MTDEELLRQFAATRSNEAFAEIVERHVDLVFSVAQRMVRTPDLAQDVAQTVFVELARQANALGSSPVMPWLHAVARRRAIDVVRSEARRRLREAVAAERDAVNRENTDWSRMAPLLDEAVNALPTADRHAVLLRFFQNKSLREVGNYLGISEDAAQKRVTRAIEQLRAQFGGRGITTTAASVAATLSTYAVQPAPAGLAGSICGAASAVAPSASATFWIMTTTKKITLAAVLFASAGTLWLESRAMVREREELTALRRATLATERDTRMAMATVARFRSSGSAPAAISPAAPEDADAATQMRAWLERVDRLHAMFREHPELSIPELALLPAAAWFSLCEDVDLGSDEKVRDAMARLRNLAENDLASRLAAALGRYAAAHDGQLPPDIAELVSSFRPAIDPSLLERYQVTHTGRLADLKGRDRINIITTRAPVDGDRDRIWNIGTNGYGSQAASAVAVRQAKAAYAAGHNGSPAVVASDLQPYLPWPVGAAKLQETFDQGSRR